MGIWLIGGQLVREPRVGPEGGPESRPRQDGYLLEKCHMRDNPSQSLLQRSMPNKASLFVLF